MDTGAYKFVLHSSADVLIDDTDNITGDVAQVFGSSVEDLGTNTSITTAYENVVINCTASITLSLLDVATATEGFLFTVKNSATSGSVTIDPDGLELIDGAATIAIPRGKACMLVCTGTAWLSLYINEIEKTDYDAATVTTSDTFNFFDDTDSDLPKTGLISDLVAALPDAGLALLGTYTAAASTSVDIGTGLDLDAAIDDTYDEYELHITSLVSAADGVIIQILMSNDGGVSFEETGYDWEYSGRGDDSTAMLSDGTAEAIATYIPLVNVSAGSVQLGNAAGESLNAVITLFDPSNASLFTSIEHRTRYIMETGGGAIIHGGGSRLVAEAVNAIRVLADTNNITSSEFKLYGVRKS